MITIQSMDLLSVNVLHGNHFHSHINRRESSMKCGDCVLFGTDACQYTFINREEDDACEVFISEKEEEQKG